MGKKRLLENNERSWADEVGNVSQRSRILQHYMKKRTCSY